MSNAVKFDRSYWPNGGTTIKTVEIDVNSLWDTHEEQMLVFVAEALIDNPPTFFFDFEKEIEVGVWLWEVTGDMLLIKTSLVDELQWSFETSHVGEHCTADEIAMHIAALQKVGDKITELIASLLKRKPDGD